MDSLPPTTHPPASRPPGLLPGRRTAVCAAVVLGGGLALAQWRGGRGGRGGWGGGESYVPPNARTAREVESHSTGTPVWTNSPGFEADTFTFTRVRYRHSGRRGGGWQTDTPDSDLNLSYRLQQMTSMRVNPDGRYLWVTDPDLCRYPFIYIVEPGALSFDPEEVLALRHYLENGGFLMLDDFWGESQWEAMEEVLQEVLPGKPFLELPLTHELYRSVFTIRSKGQVPNVRLGEQSEYDPEHRTWELPDAREVHHRAIFDDQGRMMVIATHNTDNGDGWEREGESDYYFHNFSEKISFPLGINIIFYMMTH